MDNFKAINDARGHRAGDEFLVKVAQILREVLRKSDYIGRYGGDEFVAVFPDTTPDGARVLAERIGRQVLTYCKSFEGSDLGKTLSISTGVCGATPTMEKADDLINFADQALYEAKQQGRNRCVVFNRSNTLIPS
jgi:diguanylate cyclase